MKTPFDIAADLDTPVSAYLKLAPFRPRFLLESVEGGERLARYSFIGFGDCLEVRLDAAGLDHRRRACAPADIQTRISECLARRVGAGAETTAGGARGTLARRPGRLHGLRCGPLLRTRAGAQSRCNRDAARTLCGAAFSAGIRSPDPHRGVAARWQRGRSPKPAPRCGQGFARRGARPYWRRGVFHRRPRH